ncbi:MAG: 4-oxalocrotonate tautomerase [Actinomycetales bacterium]|nr:tautomerase family protein [Tetrasphaera sp.]NLW98785.1 4-oxalocrotonate tautomerase [Actinomycetales bacterium]
MPIINVTLIEGRPPEKLRALISALTDAAVESLDAPKDSVRVILHQVPATHFAAGDVTVAERSADSSG